MVLSRLIDRVEVSNDYIIQIHLKVAYEHFPKRRHKNSTFYFSLNTRYDIKKASKKAFISVDEYVKPLDFSRGSLVVATGLEPVTPSMWTTCSGSQVKNHQRGSDEHHAESLYLLAFPASLFIRNFRRETWWVGSKHRWTRFEPRVQGGFKHEVGSTCRVYHRYVFDTMGYG